MRTMSITIEEPLYRALKRTAGQRLFEKPEAPAIDVQDILSYRHERFRRSECCLTNWPSLWNRLWQRPRATADETEISELARRRRLFEGLGNQRICMKALASHMGGLASPAGFEPALPP